MWRFDPLNASMKADTSSRPRSDSTARKRPAAQPSVFSCRRRTSAADRDTPFRSMSCRDSSSSIRRSRARTSPSRPRRAHARQGQRRVAAAGDDHVERRRQVLHQEADPLVARRIGDEVVVVQDEHPLLAPGLRVVQRRGHQHHRRRRPVRRVLGKGPVHAQGGADVGPQPHGVVVVGVERDPGRGARRPRRHPLGQQRRLAEAGRRGHHGQGEPGRGVQPRRAAAGGARGPVPAEAPPAWTEAPPARAPSGPWVGARAEARPPRAGPSARSRGH